MNKVELHISQLLFDNDCVIIPDFGGFVAVYQSSEIHPVTHYFKPASKKIAFNEKLKLNDGLLATHIAYAEKISREEANDMLTKYSRELSEKISRKERVIIPQIGELYKNPDGRVQFKYNSDQNYLDDSFGLPEFFATPVIRQEKNIKLKNTFKTREVMSTTQNQNQEQKSEKKKGSVATIWVLSIVALLLAGSAVFMFATETGRNLSGLNPMDWFGKKAEPQPEPEPVVEEEIIEEVPEVVEESESSFESSSSSENFLTSATNRYYVIAGAFVEKENAIRMRDELISKGYSNAKVLSPIGVKPVFRVTVDDFETKDDGLQRVASENSSFDNSLWVLKY